jgi:DNA-binding NarL/FixJ family response regulator
MRAAHDVPVVSVLAVDDHAALLGAVRAVVGATSGFEVVAEAQFGEDALASASARSGPHPAPDVSFAATRQGRHRDR